MSVNIADIRLRRDQALKTMSVVLVRKLLLDDLEALIRGFEQSRAATALNPSESEWRVETYKARRRLKSGVEVEYTYEREWKWANGKKVVRHVSGNGKK